jgi:hypothetical protein
MMNYVEIPLRSEIYSYFESVTLDGVLYTLSFRWNGRALLWMMDIANAAGDMLAAGIPLLPHYPLTSRFIGCIAGFPAGAFVVIDETGAMRSPGRDNFGTDIKLIYVGA